MPSHLRSSPGSFNIDQICEIYSDLHSRWKYVNDPRGSEYFASASESIQNGLTGDCDDFAILMATLIECIGGSARITLAHNSASGHAYAEVCCGAHPSIPSVLFERINIHYGGIFGPRYSYLPVQTLSYRSEAGLIWLNLDWSSNYPGGPYFKSTFEEVYYPKSGYSQIRDLSSDNLVEVIKL